MLKIGRFKFINFDKSFGIVVVVEAQALHSPNSVIDRIKDSRGNASRLQILWGDRFFGRRAIAFLDRKGDC
ncbi:MULTISPECIES: hypothetical protein [unclassified Microcoleus]|uniref:hypothetical protein n=1 Tax=unclassified Microcoleus TaxID=2642155 RepID=UPI002FD6AD77